MLQYLKTLAIAALAVFLPVKTILTAVLVLCLIDTILGTIAAKMRKEKITSKALGRSVAKLLVYEVAVLCAFLVQKYLIVDTIPVVSLISGLIGLTELTSILENANSISGSNIFANIIKLLQSKSEKP